MGRCCGCLHPAGGVVRRRCTWMTGASGGARAYACRHAILGRARVPPAGLWWDAWLAAVSLVGDTAALVAPGRACGRAARCGVVRLYRRWPWRPCRRRRITAGVSRGLWQAGNHGGSGGRCGLHAAAVAVVEVGMPAVERWVQRELGALQPPAPHHHNTGLRAVCRGRLREIALCQAGRWPAAISSCWAWSQAPMRMP